MSMLKRTYLQSRANSIAGQKGPRCRPNLMGKKSRLRPSAKRSPLKTFFIALGAHLLSNLIYRTAAPCPGPEGGVRRRHQVLNGFPVVSMSCGVRLCSPLLSS